MRFFSFALRASANKVLFYLNVPGCYVSIGDKEKAKLYFEKISTFLDKRKYGGKELPTEVLIRKKSKSFLLLN